MSFDKGVEVYALNYHKPHFRELPEMLSNILFYNVLALYTNCLINSERLCFQNSQTAAVRTLLIISKILYCTQKKRPIEFFPICSQRLVFKNL